MAIGDKKATRESYGMALAELGEKYDIVVLDADLAEATKTLMFKKKFPERFFDCGIAEGNMMGVAAGLAATGKTVFASSFAMFAAGRAFEQVRNVIGYPHLNVKIGATHAGITVGEDGATHQCLEDIALMRSIPGMIVINPADDVEAKAAVEAALSTEGPFYLRFGRFAVPNLTESIEGYKFEVGKGVVYKTGKDVTMIDLIDMQAFKYDEKGKRAGVPMKINWEQTAHDYKDALNEALANTSEDLMMKYFEGESFTKDEAVEALHNGIIDGSIVPVYCGSATNMWGVVAMLDAIAGSFPRPTARKVEKDLGGKPVAIDVEGDPAIFVYKTIADPFVGKMSFFKVMTGVLKKDMALRNIRTGANEKMAHIYIMKGKEQVEVDELACGDLGMIAKLADTNTNDTLRASGETVYAPVKYATPYMCKGITPETAKDESKISQAIAKMLEEDMTLRYENNPETKQMCIYGIGDMHLAVLCSKLKTRFGTSVKLDEPKIPYREKITKPCDVEGKHKKQNGGSGQYGHVKIRFAPGEEEGLTFVDATVGGSVPKNFIPHVQKGLEDVMVKGAAGQAVQNMNIMMGLDEKTGIDNPGFNL